MFNRREYLRLSATIASSMILPDASYGARQAILSGDRLSGVQSTLNIGASPHNPRNGEGDFIRLADGTIILAYGHFTDTSDDWGFSRLAFRSSRDGGLCWSKEKYLLADEDVSSKCVSFLRLQNGEIALFYLHDLRRQGGLKSGPRVYPVARFSKDEGQSWTRPITVASDEPYLGANNDRAVQLSTGRILLPLTGRGQSLCCFSDDDGRTFQRSAGSLRLHGPLRQLAEPGVIELEDGRVMMLMRTKRRAQYLSYSEDHGLTWSTPVPSNIASPLSPASIKRIPSTGDLLLVWNDNDSRWRGWKRLRRSPFTAAVSRDDGKTWGPSRIIYDDMDLWYCYAAMAFVTIGGEERVLLAHTAGKGLGSERLSDLWVTTFPVRGLYR